MQLLKVHSCRLPLQAITTHYLLVTVNILITAAAQQQQQQQQQDCAIGSAFCYGHNTLLFEDMHVSCVMCVVC